MYGGRDEIVPRAPIRRFVDGLPAEPVRRRKLAWYENGCRMLLRDLLVREGLHMLPIDYKAAEHGTVFAERHGEKAPCAAKLNVWPPPR